MSDSRHSTVGRVLSVVCAHYRVTPTDVLSQRRQSEIMEPRHVAMFLARRCTLQSFPQIGRALHRDHTTVQHGVHRVRQRIAAEPEFAALVDRLATTITTTAASQPGEARREVA